MDEYREYIMERVQPEPMSGCWLWDQSLRTDGYGNAFAEGKVQVAHRLSYKAFSGEIPDGICVLHRCDVRACVNPEHLWLGTRLDNVRDMYAKGRENNIALRGEDHGCSRLTEDDVREIRSANGRVPDIAARFGISVSHTYQIRSGDYWRHVA